MFDEVICAVFSTCSGGGYYEEQDKFDENSGISVRYRP
jgi:hypothetical protein